MDKEQKPWYRILWTHETIVALGGAAVWGWLLLLPAVGIAYGVTKLFGGDPDVDGGAQNLTLWGAGVLALFFGYCLGYLSGHEQRNRDAQYESWRTESDFESVYRRDISDLQAQATQGMKKFDIRAIKLSQQLRKAISRCRVCGNPSDFLYDGDDWDSVFGMCGECDHLAQSGQRMKLVPRRAEWLAIQTGVDAHDEVLLRIVTSDLSALIGNGGIKRVPLSEEDDRDGLTWEEPLTPKSWDEEA